MSFQGRFQENLKPAQIEIEEGDPRSVVMPARPSTAGPVVAPKADRPERVYDPYQGIDEWRVKSRAAGRRLLNILGTYILSLLACRLAGWEFSLSLLLWIGRKVGPLVGPVSGLVLLAIILGWMVFAGRMEIDRIRATRRAAIFIQWAGLLGIWIWSWKSGVYGGSTLAAIAAGIIGWFMARLVTQAMLGKLLPK